MFFCRSLANFEAVRVLGLNRLFLGHQHREFLRVGRIDLFADEDVGQRLVIVHKTGLVHVQDVVIEPTRRIRRVLELGQHVLDQ